MKTYVHYIFSSEIHGKIIKKNLLLHFHGRIFNIHLSFLCKSYSCKMALLIPVLKRADTNTAHCYVIHTLPVLSSFLCTFFSLFCSIMYVNSVVSLTY